MAANVQKVEDDVRRFACDRCRLHKIRCDRWPMTVLRASRIPRSNPCLRCIKLGRQCMTTPQFQSGRHKHGARTPAGQGVQTPVGQPSAAYSGDCPLDISAESDDHPADQDVFRERDETYRRDLDISSIPAVTDFTQAIYRPPIDPREYLSYQDSSPAQSREDTGVDQTNPRYGTGACFLEREDDMGYFMNPEFGLDEHKQEDSVRRIAENDVWYPSERPADTAGIPEPTVPINPSAYHAYRCSSSGFVSERPGSRTQAATNTAWYSTQQPSETTKPRTSIVDIASTSGCVFPIGGSVTTESLCHKLVDLTATLSKGILQDYDLHDAPMNTTRITTVSELQGQVENYALLLETIASSQFSTAGSSEYGYGLPYNNQPAIQDFDLGSVDTHSRLDYLSLFTIIAASYQSVLRAYNRVFSKMHASLATNGHAMLPEFQIKGSKSAMSSSLQAHMTIEMANHTLDRIERQLRLIITAHETETDEIPKMALNLLKALLYSEGDGNLSAGVRQTIRGIGQELDLYT